MVSKIPLIDLPRLLRERGVAVSYHSVWAAVVAGNFPAERQGKRWMIEPSDIPTIASFFTGTR